MSRGVFHITGPIYVLLVLRIKQCLTVCRSCLPWSCSYATYCQFRSCLLASSLLCLCSTPFLLCPRLFSSSSVFWWQTPRAVMSANDLSLGLCAIRLGHYLEIVLSLAFIGSGQGTYNDTFWPLYVLWIVMPTLWGVISVSLPSLARRNAPCISTILPLSPLFVHLFDPTDCNWYFIQLWPVDKVNIQAHFVCEAWVSETVRIWESAWRCSVTDVMSRAAPRVLIFGKPIRTRGSTERSASANSELELNVANEAKAPHRWHEQPISVLQPKTCRDGWRLLQHNTMAFWQPAQGARYLCHRQARLFPLVLVDPSPKFKSRP